VINLAGEKILIADDSANIVNLLKKILDTTGYHVIKAKDGLEALEKIVESINHKIPVDLLLTDIVMPVMDGFKLIDCLKEKDISVPVIVMTGYVTPEIIRKLELRGFGEFLIKPFSVDELLDMIERVLHRNGCCGSDC
jgi:DNA-binding NtrC family response regulator